MRGEVNSLYRSHGCACSPEVCISDPGRHPWLPAVECRLVGAAQGSSTVLKPLSIFSLSSYPTACCSCLFPHLHSMAFRSISTSCTPVLSVGSCLGLAVMKPLQYLCGKNPTPTSMSVPRISGRHTPLLSPSRHTCILLQKCTAVFERIWTGFILSSPVKELRTK